MAHDMDGIYMEHKLIIIIIYCEEKLNDKFYFFLSIVTK